MLAGTLPARARGSPPRFHREHLDRSDEPSVGRAKATNGRIRTRDYYNRRAYSLRVPLVILQRNVQVVDESSMLMTCFMHKLRSICINHGQLRAVQSNRRIVARMLLVGQRIAFTIMCPGERDCLERYIRLQRHPVSEGVST